MKLKSLFHAFSQENERNEEKVGTYVGIFFSCTEGVCTVYQYAKKLY